MDYILGPSLKNLGENTRRSSFWWMRMRRKHGKKSRLSFHQHQNPFRAQGGKK